MLNKKRLIYASTILIVLGFVIAAMLLARSQALILVNHPMSERSVMNESPADFGLAYEAVVIHSAEGNELHGWYIPSTNGAAVMLQHGYKSDRTELLEEASMLAAHGYGVLLSSVRAHDLNEGQLIAFGLKEMPDLDAWFNFLLQQGDIENGKIGMLGNSLGASMLIQYAAGNPGVKALVAHSAFSSMGDTINTSIRYYTDLPAFPFADLIRFWAELEIKGRIEDIDATRWIGDISPRPVLILHSTSDIVISPQSGELLFAAAREPKELWQVDGVDHASFDRQLSMQFEERVVDFFDQNLLEAN